MGDININKGSMLAVGSILRGIYRIDSYLSSGGFGNTYVATNIKFDEVVAIKEFFMRGVTERDANNTTVSVSNTDNESLFEEQKQKFKKEARRLRKLNNPHIVSVHDLFEENGTAYFVMDYIDGENLAVRLKRLQHPLSEEEVMGYLPQILNALEFVHQGGLCHLDLKPANIMVDRLGNITLIDFGASKQCNNTGNNTTFTAISYTNGFAPREQMEQNIEKFGPWTDFYALGATIYNLLANQKPPLPSDIDDDRSKDKHLALPLPSGVSEQTKQIILWLMKTDRLDRPQFVEEVREKMKQSIKMPTEPIDVVEEDEETDNTLVLAKKKDGGKELSKIEGVNTEERQEKKEEGREEKVKEQDNQKKEEEYEPEFPVKTPLWKKYGIPLIAAAIALVIAVIIFGGKSDKETPPISEQGTEEMMEEKTVEAMRYKNAIGDFSYKGEVNADNIPNGQGEATFDNGNYYKGTFKNGSLDGDDALFKYKIGDTFVGSFKDNFFNEGIYTIAETGEYFKGTFKNGNPAKGVWYDKTGRKLEEI